MAPTKDQDPAARDRIIKHMNADHQESVRRYVEVSPAKPWFYQLRNAKITHIDVDSMKISYAGGAKEVVVPFEPPMESLREARERLVALDKEAMEKLSRSDVVMTTFVPPYKRLPHLLSWTACLALLVLFSRQSNFEPGSLPYEQGLGQNPTVASFLGQIRFYVFWLIIFIHAFEAGSMAVALDQHSIRPYQLIWWCWVGTTFIEGATSLWRFNATVEAKKKEKDAEAKKH